MKRIIYFITFLLLLPCSFAQVTDHLESDQKDFKFTDSTTIDIYCSSQIFEKAAWDELKPEVRQRRIVDKLVEVFRENVPMVTPVYGKNDLPPVYNKEPTLNSKEEMKEFLDKTKSDFVLIVSKVTSVEKPERVYNYDTGSSYTMYGNHKIKIYFELWEVKKQTIVMDFEINQDGGTWIDRVLSKAVEYIKNKGTAEKKVYNFK